jgi:hypothetical protein
VNFFNTQNPAGGLNMNANSMPGMRMQTAPMIPGMANLQAPSGAFNLPGGGMSDMQLANLAMGLMGSANQQAPEAPMMQMTQAQPASLGQDTQQFMQQYGLNALMQNQGQNDEMMRQRMQGLMALLGGQ